MEKVLALAEKMDEEHFSRPVLPEPFTCGQATADYFHVDDIESQRDI